nr:hypothetical protein [uncultured Pseudodesulfovibrio sp.]
MSGKISPFEVGRQAISLIEVCPKLFLGAFVVSLVVGGPFPFFPIDGFADWPVWLKVYSPLSLIFNYWLCIVVYHFAINTLRQRDIRLVPKQSIKKVLYSLWKTFLLLFVAGIPGMALTIVLLVPLYVAYPEGLSTDVEIWTGSVAALIGFGLVLTRLWVPFVAIGVDESASFKRSWRMSRGHTFRIFFFFFPYSIMTLFCSSLIPVYSGEATMPILVVVLSFAATIFNWVLFWFLEAVFIIWYERLQMRYNASIASVELSKNMVVNQLHQRKSGIFEDSIFQTESEFEYDEFSKKSK